jgi:two-component system chemotaxis response regulator CheB
MPSPRFSTSRLRIIPEVIAIGASAGGPGALRAVFHELPADFPVPIVVVQHMPDEFVTGLARWLHKATPLRVVVAADNLVLEPGVVHLGPGSAHLSLTRRPDNRLAVRLLAARGPYRYQPAVDVLFESVAQVCGRGAVGLVMTGMGDDGAAGLLAMRQAGAVTLAQDEASCTVYGMPGAAVARGAVEHVLALSNLATTLVNLI